MTTDGHTPIETWLAYADLGIPIVPEHTPDPITATGCDCHHDDCTKPGKHPRTKNGSKDATTDEATIKRWFRMWPRANIGTSLDLAGLVIIGPDSPEWAAEFERRGLPPGPITQSGGGEGHLHHYYRLPPGVPATRICKSGEYDILANGNAILAPSLHVSGRRYEWLTPITSLDTIPYLPEWACNELRAAAGRTSRPAGNHRGGGDVDGPPIVLSTWAREVWEGRHPKLKPDGQVNRSDSLFKIGGVLYDAGALRRLIVAELVERDATLYQRYTTRADAVEQYHRIVDRLEQNGRAAPMPPEPPPMGTDGEQTCRSCQQSSEREREHERARKVWELVRQRGGWSPNETAILKTYALAAASAASRAVTRASILSDDTAGRTGVSRAAISRLNTTYQVLQDDPEIRPLLPFTIEQTERAGDYRKPWNVVVSLDELGLPRASTATEMAELLAQVCRPKMNPDSQGDGRHGGARWRCPKPEHTGGKVTRTRRDFYRCDEPGCTEAWEAPVEVTRFGWPDSEGFHDENTVDGVQDELPLTASAVEDPTYFHHEISAEGGIEIDGEPYVVEVLGSPQDGRFHDETESSAGGALTATPPVGAPSDGRFHDDALKLIRTPARHHETDSSLPPPAPLGGSFHHETTPPVSFVSREDMETAARSHPPAVGPSETLRDWQPPRTHAFWRCPAPGCRSLERQVRADGSWRCASRGHESVDFAVLAVAGGET